MNGKKTYLIAVAMLVHAAASYFLGNDVTLNLQEIFGAMGLAALRHGVGKLQLQRPESLAPGLRSMLFFAALTIGFTPSMWAAGQPGTRNPEPGTAPKELANVTLTYAEPKPGRVYLDIGSYLATSDFRDSSETGYGVRLGYQVSKHWSFDFGASHQGLDFDGSAVQDLSGRVVARLPFEFLSPYTFVGGRRDLERREWYIEPGAGIEVGVSKTLRGLSVYAEGKVSASVERREWKPAFEGGIRLRF